MRPLEAAKLACMARSIRVAVAQLRARDRSEFPQAADGILDVVRSGAQRADLLVLPEATFPGYVLGRVPLEAGEIDEYIERLRVIARETECVIVAGAALRDGGALRNGAIVIDADGSLAGRADKLFLWHFDRLWFERGQRLAPVATRAGVLGVLVCADGRLPTIARALVDASAEALVMPTAWVTSGRDPHALENVQADLLGRVRAYENRVPFIAANKCGSELGMVAYCGKSQIVDGGGEVLALAGELEPETLVASVALRDQSPDRVPAAHVPPRQIGQTQPMRLAISYELLPSDIDERLELLDDAYAISSQDPDRLALLNRVLPLVSAGDDTVLDPGGLVAYRRAGYTLVCWKTELAPPWLERIARSRALELRMYLVVFDSAARRAFAVDPDGAIVAGTFDDFRLASFSLDPRKASEMAVAPGTDVGEGLERVATLIGESP